MAQNITLMTLSPYSPELNPVENVWPFLRQSRPANRVFDSCETIVDACCVARNGPSEIPDRAASITMRDLVQVNPRCRWYKMFRLSRNKMCFPD